jgi:putative copper export protein
VTANAAIALASSPPGDARCDARDAQRAITVSNVTYSTHQRGPDDGCSAGSFIFHSKTPVPPQPLIEWSEPVMELIGFIALFLTAGAIGFRFSALRGTLSAPRRPATSSTAALFDDSVIYHAAARRAAVHGLIGAVIAIVLAVQSLPALAHRAHTTTSALLSSNSGAQMLIGFAALAVIGFLLASARIGAGWPLAAIGVVLGTLRGVFAAKWSQLVNPVHELAAGLWIGTLFVMVVAGLALVFRRDTPGERRGPITAAMVNGFSPLALVCGALVVIFGVITAWKHLNPLSSLWTTPYGYALIAKLVVVAIVFGLGAWNWQRGRPTSGTEAGATGLRRSAAGELTAAGIVLVITAILVSLPSPRRPKPAAPTGAPATTLR